MATAATSTPRPRLAFVVTHPYTADRLLRGQLAYLRQQGFDILVITSPSDRLEKVRRREGVEVAAVAMEREIRPLRDLASLGDLRSTLAAWRPHIINCSTPKAGLLGTLAGLLARIPIRIYTLRGLRLETTRGPKRALLRVSERTTAACAHRVVAVSRSLRQRYSDLGLAAAEKIELLGAGASNGVDAAHFASRDPAREHALRRQLGLTPEMPVIGAVGRLTRDKGIAELLQAFRELRHHLPRLRLLILGDFESGDPLSAETRQGVRDDPAILLTGSVSDPAHYYPLMDVVAFPSHREGFPNVPLEAAAAGLPVVGCRVTGTVDAVVDGTTGTLVPAADPRALGQALLTYLRDLELARRHGRAGQERVRQLFDRSLVWDRWRTFYHDLCQRHPDCPNLES